MDGLKAVEELALYLNKNQKVKVFKFEKTPKYSGEYIVVNSLPFIYGRVVNDSNVLNVNLHVPKRTTGNANVARLTEILEDVTSLIPFDMDVEDVVGMFIGGSYYSITSVSTPIEDNDGTYYLNLKVKIITSK